MTKRQISIKEQYGFTDQVNEIIHKGFLDSNLRPTESSYFNLFDRPIPYTDVDNFIMPEKGKSEFDKALENLTKKRLQRP